MNDFLNVKVGMVGIETDMKKQTDDINKTVHGALRWVSGDMLYSFYNYLFGTWYNGYTPLVYERRTDNPSLGRPLGDKKNISISVDNGRLTFDYSPTGYHATQFFSVVRNGDDLIESIQTGKLWGNPPPRPFWNNFVKEQETEALDSFIRAMKPYKVEKENSERLDFKDSYLDSKDN